MKALGFLWFVAGEFWDIFRDWLTAERGIVLGLLLLFLVETVLGAYSILTE